MPTAQGGTHEAGFRAALLKGLRAWKDEHPKSRCVLVCRAPRARTTEDQIEILPWQGFLRRLWAGEFLPE